MHANNKIQIVDHQRMPKEKQNYREETVEQLNHKQIKINATP